MPESVQSATVPSLLLLNERRTDLNPPIRGVVKSDGRFEIRDLRPGKYVLRAYTGDDWAKEGNLLVEQVVDVGVDDVGDLVLPLHVVEPAEIPGIVTLENGNSLGPLGIGYFKDRSDEFNGGAISGDDGSFVLRLLPGQYHIWVIPDPRRLGGNKGAQRSADRTQYARQRKPRIVSAFLGDMDITEKGFHFDGMVRGPLRITVRMEE
jgi:hypothetical protein